MPHPSHFLPWLSAHTSAHPADPQPPSNCHACRLAAVASSRQLQGSARRRPVQMATAAAVQRPRHANGRFFFFVFLLKRDPLNNCCASTGTRPHGHRCAVRSFRLWNSQPQFHARGLIPFPAAPLRRGEPMPEAFVRSVYIVAAADSAWEVRSGERACSDARH